MLDYFCFTSIELDNVALIMKEYEFCFETFNIKNEVGIGRSGVVRYTVRFSTNIPSIEILRFISSKLGDDSIEFNTFNFEAVFDGIIRSRKVEESLN